MIMSLEEEKWVNSSGVYTSGYVRQYGSPQTRQDTQPNHNCERENHGCNTLRSTVNGYNYSVLNSGSPRFSEAISKNTDSSLLHSLLTSQQNSEPAEKETKFSPWQGNGETYKTKPVYQRQTVPYTGHAATEMTGRHADFTDIAHRSVIESQNSHGKHWHRIPSSCSAFSLCNDQPINLSKRKRALEDQAPEISCDDTIYDPGFCAAMKPYSINSVHNVGINSTNATPLSVSHLLDDAGRLRVEHSSHQPAEATTANGGLDGVLCYERRNSQPGFSQLSTQSKLTDHRNLRKLLSDPVIRQNCLSSFDQTQSYGGNDMINQSRLEVFTKYYNEKMQLGTEKNFDGAFSNAKEQLEFTKLSLISKILNSEPNFRDSSDSMQRTVINSSNDYEKVLRKSIHSREDLQFTCRQGNLEKRPSQSTPPSFSVSWHSPNAQNRDKPSTKLWPTKNSAPNSEIHVSTSQNLDLPATVARPFGQEHFDVCDQNQSASPMGVVVEEQIASQEAPCEEENPLLPVISDKAEMKSLYNARLMLEEKKCSGKRLSSKQTTCVSRASLRASDPTSDDVMSSDEENDLKQKSIVGKVSEPTSDIDNGSQLTSDTDNGSQLTSDTDNGSRLTSGADKTSHQTTVAKNAEPRETDAAGDTQQNTGTEDKQRSPTDVNESWKTTVPANDRKLNSDAANEQVGESGAASNNQLVSDTDSDSEESSGNFEGLMNESDNQSRKNDGVVNDMPSAYQISKARQPHEFSDSFAGQKCVPKKRQKCQLIGANDCKASLGNEQRLTETSNPCVAFSEDCRKMRGQKSSAKLPGFISEEVVGDSFGTLSNGNKTPQFSEPSSSLLSALHSMPSLTSVLSDEACTKDTMSEAQDFGEEECVSNYPGPPALSHSHGPQTPDTLPSNYSAKSSTPTDPTHKMGQNFGSPLLNTFPDQCVNEADFPADVGGSGPEINRNLSSSDIESLFNGSCNKDGDPETTNGHLPVDMNVDEDQAGNEPRGPAPCQPAIGTDQSVMGRMVNPQGFLYGSSHMDLVQGPSSVMQEVTSSVEERKRTRRTGISSIKMSGKRCEICQDSASGFHYGVWSCEGCKAFFKRSLQGHVDYVCPAVNKCTIDRNRRKSCQACRLRKCVEMGMSRGVSRKEKNTRLEMEMSRKQDLPDKNENQGCKRGCTHDTPISSVPEGKRMYDAPVSSICEKPSLSTSKQLDNLSPDTNSSKNKLSSLLNMPSSLSQTSMVMHPFVAHLISIEPQIKFSKYKPKLPETAYSIMSQLLRLADADLLDVVHWAKCVPGYSDVNLETRIQLLEACWMEVLLIGLVWRSLPYDDVLVFAADLHLDKERMLKSRCNTVWKGILKLVTQVKQFNITLEEVVLLKATVLLNADVTENATSGEHLRELQQQLYEVWDYTMIKRAQHSAARLFSLQLLLPHFKRCALDSISVIFQLNRKENMPVDDLLKEMIKVADLDSRVGN